MSAQQANPVIFLLPLNARDMDAEASEHEAQPYERLLKKLIVHGDEFLGVSDWSFFYVKTNDSVRFLQRDRLYYILSDQRLETSVLINTILKKLASVELESKPFLAYSLISPYLPSYIFANIDRAPISIDELINLLIGFGKAERVVEVCKCEEIENKKEAESIYGMLYGSLLDALRLLKVDYSYGISEGEPCIVIDRKSKTGVIVTGATEHQ